MCSGGIQLAQMKCPVEQPCRTALSNNCHFQGTFERLAKDGPKSGGSSQRSRARVSRKRSSTSPHILASFSSARLLRRGTRGRRFLHHTDRHSRTGRYADWLRQIGGRTRSRVTEVRRVANLLFSFPLVNKAVLNPHPSHQSHPVRDHHHTRPDVGRNGHPHGCRAGGSGD